jgi:hypothetical protein
MSNDIMLLHKLNERIPVMKYRLRRGKYINQNVYACLTKERDCILANMYLYIESHINDIEIKSETA